MTLSVPTSRDFLSHRPEADIEIGGSILDALQQQNRLNRDIARSLRKLTPDVLTSTVAERTNLTGYVPADTAIRVHFEIGGKPVTVYKILAFANDSGSQNIKINLEPPNANYDGFALPINAYSSENEAQVFDIPVTELWVYDQYGAFTVNRHSNSTEGNRSLWLFGWTVPQFDELDTPLVNHMR